MTFALAGLTALVGVTTFEPSYMKSNKALVPADIAQGVRDLLACPGYRSNQFRLFRPTAFAGAAD